MGTISREGTAPIESGDDLDASEVEAEFNKVFNVINGNLDNANIASDADIAGSKLADNGVANAKLTDDTITTAKMAASAVPKAYVSSATGATEMTSSATMVDVPGITAATMTAGSTDDMLVIDLNVTAFLASVGSTPLWEFAFSVDGTDTDSIARFRPKAINDSETVHVAWAVTAPSTSAIVIKPRYKSLDASSTGTFGGNTRNRIFRVQIIPIKS